MKKNMTRQRPDTMAQSNNGGRLEMVHGFDSARVLTQNFHKRQLLKRLRQDYLLESSDLSFSTPQSSIGRDDRAQITETSAIPWRCICQLVVEGLYDQQVLGTGWMAGPSTVITAGHNLLSKETHRKAKRIYVIPGRNGDDAPYGYYETDDFEVHQQWENAYSEAHDLGVIWLDKPIGNKLGWFGTATYPNNQFNNLIVNTSGYPSDKRLGTQWYNAGRIDEVNEDTLSYGLDTQAGQSGSPIFHYDTNDQRLVVAVHAYGFGSKNVGIRINDEVFDLLGHWIR